MKLYDSDEKFCHCNLKTNLSNELTITFSLQINKCLDRDYVLVDKSGEFLVKLSKKNKIYFYVGDKCGSMKVQAKTSDLDSCKCLNIAIVRNIECKRINIFVNGVLNVTECIDDELLVIPKSCSEVVVYTGGDCSDYEMRSVQIYNEVLNFDEVKGFNCCDKNVLLSEIFCKMYETHRFEDNIYYYIMTPNGLIYFPNESKKYGSPSTENRYPEFAFRYYNIEQNERLLNIDGMKCARYDELCKLFDIDQFATNLVTWQFQDASCEFQQAHPKNVFPEVGYWSPSLGLNPFTPYLDKDIPAGSLPQYTGNLKNGFVVSFVKLLMDRYVCTKNKIYLTAIDKLVTYLINLFNGGIPDDYPVGTPLITNNVGKTSLQQGNYLNYLKILDCILNHDSVRNIIDDVRISLLQKMKDDALSLLLKLQVECGGRLSIWAEFYTATATSGVDAVGSAGIPIFAPLLTVPESVEILLYLMNVSCPTADIKKAIKAGIEWLKSNRLDKYVQYFDGAKMKIVKNNYQTVPEQDVLHPHYYSIFAYNMADAPIPACGAMFYDTATVYSAVNPSLPLPPPQFPGNFNGLPFDQQIDRFGTWAQCALELYEQWVEIYDSPCSPLHKGKYVSSSKCSKSKGCSKC
jgi:PelA/Pel-15E family pectate lyase